MIKIYRKTATIKAEQFDGSDEMIEKYNIAIGSGWVAPYRINTLEGWVGVQINSWIATGVNGDHWVIADDVFKKTYAELPVIPRVWGDMIEVLKDNDYPLSEMFTESDYNCDEQELIARAWLDGYVVEDHD